MTYIRSLERLAVLQALGGHWGEASNSLRRAACLCVDCEDQVALEGAAAFCEMLTEPIAVFGDILSNFSEH